MANSKDPDPEGHRIRIRMHNTVINNQSYLTIINVNQSTNKSSRCLKSMILKLGTDLIHFIKTKEEKQSQEYTQMLTSRGPFPSVAPGMLRPERLRTCKAKVLEPTKNRTNIINKYRICVADPDPVSAKMTPKKGKKFHALKC
jgi:hypothetical protein